MGNGANGTGLRANSLGLLSLATFGAVMMSPALGLYGLFGPLASLVGKATPLVFLGALLVSLPTAVSYALVNREMPSAGSAFTWVWVSMSPAVGTWVGLMMVVYYTVAVILQPILFGLFCNDLIGFLGFDRPDFGSWSLGVLLCTFLIVYITYRGIEISTRSALLFMVIEIGVVVALSCTIFVVKVGSGEFSLAPFHPGEVTGGLPVFWQAMVLGILSFTGYDVISTVAEEARAPRRLLPQATLLATVGVGFFWVINSWAFSISVPVERVQELTAAGLTAATPIAAIFWGPGQIFVIFTAMTAAAAVYVATVVGSSRAIYAMARQGMLPAAFSRLHPRFQVPWNAMHLVYLSSLAGAFVVTALLKNTVEAFVWWAGAVVFFALITYLAVNLANLLFFLRFARDRFNWFLNGVLPVGGILLDVYLIYRCFFRELWSAGFRTGQSIVLFSMALVLGGILYVLYLRTYRPELMRAKTTTAVMKENGQGEEL